MARPTPEPNRRRGREIIAMAVSLLLTLGIGKSLVALFHNPTFVVQAAILVLLYLVLYVLCWRALARVWPY